MKDEKYEVWIVDAWVRCKRAQPQKSGWLHYELADGTNGLARPSKWRIQSKQEEGAK